MGLLEGAERGAMGTAHGPGVLGNGHISVWLHRRSAILGSHRFPLCVPLFAPWPAHLLHKAAVSQASGDVGLGSLL